MFDELTISGFSRPTGDTLRARWITSFLASLSLVLLTALPAGAVVQLRNQDMPDNLDSWTLSSGGNWSHAAGQGIFGAKGAAEVSSTGAGAISMSQCTDVSSRMPGGSLYASYYARTVNHTSAVEVEVEMFSGANCTGGSLDVGFNTRSTSPMDVWTYSNIVQEIPPAGASSARFTMKVTSTGAGQVTRFAHALLAENLLRNGHFRDDVTDWAVNRGPWDHSTSDGFSDPTGVAQATNEDAWTILATCDSLTSQPYGPSSGSVLYIAGAAFKPLDAPEQQRLLLEWYREPNCTDQLDIVTFFSAPTPAVGEWSTLGGFRLRPPEAKSYVLRIGSNSNDQFPATADSRVLWDNVYLVPLNWLWVDGFESGNTSQWSKVVQP